MQAAQSVLLIVADDMQPSDIHALRHLHAPPILAETPWQALEHVPIWNFEPQLTASICYLYKCGNPPRGRLLLVVVGQRSQRRARRSQARPHSSAAAARGPVDRCSTTVRSLPARTRHSFMPMLRDCRRRLWIDW